MKVLQVLPSFDADFGGPVNSAYAVALAYERFAAVQSIGTSTPGHPWRERRAVGYAAYHLPFTPRFIGTFSPQLLRAVRGAAAENDVMHVHMQRGLVCIPAVLAAPASVKVVLQLHGMCMPWAWPKRVLDETFTFRCLRRADAVICLSEEEKHAMQATGAKNVVVIPNAIEPGWTQAASIYGGTGDLRLLFCARLHPRKGLELYLRTCHEVSLRGFPVRAVVAGADEGALAEGRQLAAELALRADFLGALDRNGVAEVMRSSHALLHPALHEPFGMSMLEAMAVGLPVVTTQTSVLATQFRECGAAALPDYDTPSAWADTIVQQLADPDRTAGMVAAGAKLVGERFNINALADHLERMVASL